MESMFCYQCEQTAKGSGCTISGVCGKKADTAHEQDILTCELIGLAQAVAKAKAQTPALVDQIVDALFATVTNVNFDAAKIAAYAGALRAERERLGGAESMKPEALFHGDRNLTALRSTLLFGLRGMAAYACHARVLGRRDPAVDDWFIKGMAALGDTHSVEQWIGLLLELGTVNLQCMALLDAANTGAYGDPVPTSVPLTVEKGPFIIVTGHDLHDLHMLLEQTQGRGVNIYTHGEMLPAHGYPELKKYPQLKGNFGTAWQNQQKEFVDIPAPVLFTTNCLMPPKPDYADRVYTTAVVGFPEMRHIPTNAGGYKDFSGLIEHALRLGGFAEDRRFTGINGGTQLTTGFGRRTLLDNAAAIIQAVKTGAIKRFFLVGGCDGAKAGRNYYTEFVRQAPKDTIILTLGCGKYRFNDMDAGVIGPFPRILDMGQCNDAYGAVQVALALAEAFHCGVNDLPLTLVLSWYEQKAVCILLTLLSLGIRDIYIGPSLPAFFSNALVSMLAEQFNLRMITRPEQDLEESIRERG